MDLKNYQITMGELMQDPKARAVLTAEFPQFAASPMMIRLSRNMTLQKVIRIGEGHVSRTQIQRAVTRLQKL